MALRKGSSRAVGVVQLAASVLVSASALLMASAPAQAHHYRYHHAYARHFGRVHAHYASAQAPYAPPFSAIVVDANSGRTLYAVAEDGQRHPASITKVMTLYLLFEQLEKGTMTLQTRIPIS